MPDLTRGGLVPATLSAEQPNITVHCMFNPFEYTITKTNAFDTSKSTKGVDTPQGVFSQGGAKSLKLTLHFDTQDSGEDVTTVTDDLWKLMMVNTEQRGANNQKSAPPKVKFTWGSLTFEAYIKTMTQKFILFSPTGKPLRCTVDVTLEQMDNPRPSQRQRNAGGAPRPTTTPNAADRPDNIAAQSGASQREVAERNNVDDPLRMRPGRPLV
jgi:hypothetical protein